MPISVLSTAEAVRRANQADRTKYSALRPVLIGPRAGLHRFSVTGERASLGAYDALDDTAYAYTDKVADSVVDLTSVKLYAADARLNYFNKYIGLDGTCQPSSAYPNRVRASDFVFKTGNGADRSTTFGSRDVKVGDVAVVRLGAETLTTTVIGFVGETVASTRDAATADANNRATQVQSETVEQVDGTPINDVVVTADGSAYDSLADGYITRTYLVTVTQSSTGGDATTALLRVRSSDGLDDQDDVVPAAFGAPTNIGTKGHTLTFAIDTGNSSASLFGIDEDDFVVGQQWTTTVNQAFTAPTATSAGTYTGTLDDTYIITVSTGGLYTGGTPKITVTTANGSDASGPTTVTAASTAIAIGNYGVTISFDSSGLRKGDAYYVVVGAVGEGALKTLKLQDDVPEDMRGQEVDLRLFAARTSVEIPRDTTTWSRTADGLTVKAAIELEDSEFDDPVPLDSAILYVEYREWLTSGAAEVVELSSPDAVEAALGTVDPDNPIAQAAALALANTSGVLLDDQGQPNADTTDRVLCVSIGGDPADTDLWTAVLEAIEENDDAYHLVPLTADPAVHALFVAHVDERSTDAEGFYRVTWLAASVDETGVLVSATTTDDVAAVTATFTVETGTSPTTYTQVTASANAKFVTKGVRAGDVVRVNYGTDEFGDETYDEYEVEEVQTETSLITVTGPAAAIDPARRIEVWRTYTKNELVTNIVAVATSYANSRVRYVWPDRAGFGGTTYDGYLVCAALAGLAGSVPSHQGLRNVGLEGFDDIGRSSGFFTGRQLKTLGAGGVFVVDHTPAGVVYTRVANSTDPTSAGTREEMVTRNADMLRKAIQVTNAPYIGSGNVVSGLRDLLEAAVASLTAQLKAANFTRELGSPVANLRLSSLTTVTGEATEVEVEYEAVGLPVPLNQIRVRMPVTV